MNVPETNTAAPLINWRLDKDTNFKYTMNIDVNGSPHPLDYWEAEFVVFFPKTCKQVAVWSLTSGDLVVTGTGVIEWDILIEIERAEYEYYFKIVDENGDIFKYMKGKFIVE